MDNIVVRFEIASGHFDMLLDLQSAPITAGYFRDLVAGGALDNTSLFRIVTKANAEHRADCPIEVIQGGRKDTDDHAIPPVEHEPTTVTGLKHDQWTVSAARFDPGETYGSFFICMRDEPALDFGGERHMDGLGFAAFGKIIAGFELLEQIHQAYEPQEYLDHEIVISRAYFLET